MSSTSTKNDKGPGPYFLGIPPQSVFHDENSLTERVDNGVTRIQTT